MTAEISNLVVLFYQPGRKLTNGVGASRNNVSYWSKLTLSDQSHTRHGIRHLGHFCVTFALVVELTANALGSL